LFSCEAEIRSITVQGQPGQTIHKTSISKITSTKWTGGMAEVIEHLLCNHEALSSNPSTTKKKQKKEEEKGLIRFF
jgi:hypothetical protein